MDNCVCFPQIANKGASKVGFLIDVGGLEVAMGISAYAEQQPFDV